jgi:hypothetical protein
MSKLKTMSAVLVAATTLTLASVGNAQAAVITGVTTTTNMGGIGLNRIADNSGLSVPNSLTATHANAVAGVNSWTSSIGLPGILTGNVDFNLGGIYKLNTMSVWNANSTGLLANLVRNTGIQSVNILTSLDGTTFTALKNQVFAKGENNAQSVALDLVQAKFVRFNIASNYGSILSTGFSGAKFDGTAVPTPALLPGLAGMGIAAFRKRRDKAAKTVAA